MSMFQLFRGPLDGTLIDYSKKDIRIRLRVDGHWYVAKYGFTSIGYCHEGTELESKIETDKEAAVLTATYVNTETPPSWEGDKYKGTPWPKWFLWQLKE